MIRVLQLPLGPMQTNCYILGCEQTMQAAVIDPSWDGRRIIATTDDQGLEITHILLTHSHFDHVGGLAQLKEETNAPIYIHPDAVEMLAQTNLAASLFNVQLPTPPPADKMLAEGQVIQVGNAKLEVLYTPGHAPGHVSFYLAEHHTLFDGDVLFQHSIGRTDLPGGDYQTLIQTIKNKLMVLPDETNVLSGHGPATTIGHERLHNLFLRDIS